MYINNITKTTWALPSSKLLRNNLDRIICHGGGVEFNTQGLIIVKAENLRLL